MGEDTLDEGGEAPCFAHLLDDDATDPLDFEALVEGLADAVIAADRDGRITFWNGAATRLFGHDPDDAVGRTLDLIIPERLRQRHWDGYSTVMMTGRTRYGTEMLHVPAVHQDGHTFSVAFTVTLLTQDGHDEPHAIVAVLRDDTERYELARARHIGE